MLLSPLNYQFRSKDFRPAFRRIAEIRALVPPGTPLMACTATATRSIREEIVSCLEMMKYVTISLSPNRPNIKYVVKKRTTIDSDFAELLATLQMKLAATPRVIVYCRTLMMCADLFSYFDAEMDATQYYPPGSKEQSDNRLFGMFHASSPQHSKDVIIKSLQV